MSHWFCRYFWHRWVEIRYASSLLVQARYDRTRLKMVQCARCKTCEWRIKR